MKRTIIVAVGCAAVLLAPATTLAGRNDSVDPGDHAAGPEPGLRPVGLLAERRRITCEGQLRNA